jgi:hypothetical protein
MRAIRFAPPLAAFVLVAGCSFSDMSAGQGEAQKSVTSFHALLNDGRFDEIYDGASDEFRGGTARKHFEELLGAVLRKLGKVTGTQTKTWRVNSWNMRTFVELAQSTRFERGDAEESFRFAVQDGKARLIAYNIQSQELIVR